MSLICRLLLLDIFSQASTDMEDGLERSLSSLHRATKHDLERLIETGERLLKRKVSKVNLQTGNFEPYSEKTNEEALKDFAKQLSDEKHLRDHRSP